MLLDGTMRKDLLLNRFSFDSIMNLPITEKEFKYILEKVKHNTSLYNKLWSHWFVTKNTRKSENGFS